MLVVLEKIGGRAHGTVEIVSGNAVSDVDNVQVLPFLESKLKSGNDTWASTLLLPPPVSYGCMRSARSIGLVMLAIPLTTAPHGSWTFWLTRP